MIKPKIAMIIVGKFPTPKAYGVTARETLTVLLMDSYPTKVYCFKGSYDDKDFEGLTNNMEFFRTNMISKVLIRIGERGTFFSNKFFWFLGFAYSLIRTLKSLRSYSPDIVWCRHPLIAFFCVKALSNTKIVLEVHDKSSVFFHKLLLKNKKYIYYFPINEENRKFLNVVSPNIATNIAPMGVQSENINNINNVDLYLQSLSKKLSTNLQIGYVGKFAPQGYSKGVEDLILLAKYYQSNGIQNRVSLIGGTQNDMNTYLNLQSELDIKKSYLEIKPHVNHTEAMKLMKNFDVLVLPLPDSQEYVGMPLKLIEYLASGRITIIANSELITGLFSQKFTPYKYIKGDIFSLHRTIQLATADDKLRQQIVLGLEFAAKFSWEFRTRQILSKVIDA
jgi:glycosyltransferase involved in cell wall biosynthesis